MKVETTPYPPAGWNSYDSYGVYITEKDAYANIDTFVERLKPAGYEYFTIDACWYLDGGFEPGQDGQSRKINLDECGRMVASPVNFPNGLKGMADRCHAGGIKFGVHIMRGIAREACKQNLPIKDSTATARDIADTESLCTWGTFLYGVDMSKPGAQEYYDSFIEYLAENGVDFIKADDIVEFPDEVEAVAKAIAKVDRPIVLSLSPGNETFKGNWESLSEHGNMLRISCDIWDLDAHLAPAFDRWESWEEYGDERCWLDLDMLPLGALQVHVPEGTPDDKVPVLGCTRQTNFQPGRKRTVVTQRAMAASPLIFGGDLPTTRDEDFDMVTNPEMLACNRNGLVGKKIFEQRHIDIRKVPKKGEEQHGWIGIFNRQERARTVSVSAAEMGLGDDFSGTLHDIWNDCEVELEEGRLTCELDVFDVCFLRY